jgi:hypothetical protein
MPYQIGSAPPGLRGYLMSRQNQAAEGQTEMQGLLGMLRLKQAQEEAAQRAQMQPLQMELMKAQVEAQRQAAQAAPQKAAMEAALKQAQLEKAQREGRQAQVQQQAQMGLAGLLGGNFAPNLTGVMTDENQAREAAIAADRAGQQVNIGVPNPANVQALSVLANPQRAIPELLKQQRPQTANESPIARVMRERAALPPGDPRGPLMDKYIEKLSTHQPGVSVYSGPTAGVDANNNPVFFQPSNREGVDPRIVPGIKPMPKEPTQRAIPTPLANKLTEAAELADATARFSSTFKDGFAGKTLTGDLSNTTGKLFGDSTGQAQWWQDYELHQSQIRNKLFGSALTPAEIEAWNKSAINPRMAPGEIRKNLTRRNTLENSGLNRLMKGVAAGGYNKDQIEAFTGRTLDGSAPAAPSGPKRLRFDAQGNLVQ